MEIKNAHIELPSSSTTGAIGVALDEDARESLRARAREEIARAVEILEELKKRKESPESKTEGGESGEQENLENQEQEISEDDVIEAMKSMTDDEKLQMLNDMGKVMTEDEVRRIAYAVFQEEYSGIANEIEIYTSRMIQSMKRETKRAVDGATRSAEDKIKAIKKAIEELSATRVIEVKLESDEVVELGLAHAETEWLIKLLKKPRHAFIAGPAGSGKTTCAEQVARALGLTFHPVSVGPETMKSDLMGFIDANGNYHTTQVREAFERGGLLLLDEIDAGNGASITIMNSLLSNGYCSFPDGVIKRHENFRCIAAANTYGRGADRLYVGRNQLDAATLDRFVFRSFGYDEELERRLAGDDKWVDRVQEIRKKASELRLRVVVSPRASIIGASMLADGFSREDVEESLIFKHDEDFKRKIDGK